MSSCVHDASPAPAPSSSRSSLAAAARPAAGTTRPPTLTVFAASSLKAPSSELKTEFETDHDGVEVDFFFGGSSDLVAQIQQGADADVFASADEANMDKLAADDLAGDPAASPPTPSRSSTPPDNPGGVENLDDLTDDLDLVLCAPEVPCGAAASSSPRRPG